MLGKNGASCFQSLEKLREENSKREMDVMDGMDLMDFLKSIKWETRRCSADL